MSVYNMWGFLTAYMITMVVMFALAILSYVFTSLSLYTIAKRRCIPKAFLAWIPIANYWAMGSIADEYDSRRGIKRKWRVVLLSLSIAFMVSFIIVYFYALVSSISIAMKYQYITPDQGEMIGFMITMIIFIAIISVVSMANMACSIICTYKIFESTVPEKALKYFLISLLVPFASPFCLFACRNKGYSNIPANPYVQQQQMYNQQAYNPNNNQY